MLRVASGPLQCGCTVRCGGCAGSLPHTPGSSPLGTAIAADPCHPGSIWVPECCAPPRRSLKPFPDVTMTALCCSSAKFTGSEHSSHRPAERSSLADALHCRAQDSEKLARQSRSNDSATFTASASYNDEYASLSAIPASPTRRVTVQRHSAGGRDALKAREYLSQCPSASNLPPSPACVAVSRRARSQHALNCIQTKTSPAHSTRPGFVPPARCGRLITRRCSRECWRLHPRRRLALETASSSSRASRASPRLRPLFARRGPCAALCRPRHRPGNCGCRGHSPGLLIAPSPCR